MSRFGIVLFGFYFATSLSAKVAVQITYQIPTGIYEFEPDSPEGMKHAWNEREWLLSIKKPVPAWAAPYRERKDAENAWCLANIPGWGTFPQEWEKDIYGNDVGGRYAYLVHNEELLKDWIQRGNIRPWWAVTRGVWKGPGSLSAHPADW